MIVAGQRHPDLVSGADAHGTQSRASGKVGQHLPPVYQLDLEEVVG